MIVVDASVLCLVFHLVTPAFIEVFFLSHQLSHFIIVFVVVFLFIIDNNIMCLFLVFLP